MNLLEFLSDIFPESYYTFYLLISMKYLYKTIIIQRQIYLWNTQILKYSLKSIFSQNLSIKG